jgi:hypothetical protein
MSGSYDQRAAARKDADLMVTDLMNISGMLEEVATVWRRAEIFGQKRPSSSPGSLQAAARSLAETLHVLPDADPRQHPALAFSAVTQLAAFENNAAFAAAVTESHLCDVGMWAAIQSSLDQVGKQLWGLISHLVKITETPLTEDAASGVLSRK